MSMEKDTALRPMPEQITYANILGYGAWTGIVLMFIGYAIYAFGILEPHVDMILVTQSWGKNVHEYMAITNSPNGWNWLTLLHTGDFINFIALAFLALLTIICYLVLVPGFIRRKDWIYCGIALAEVVVLSLAASGIFGSGGH